MQSTVYIFHCFIFCIFIYTFQITVDKLENNRIKSESKEKNSVESPEEIKAEEEEKIWDGM